MLPVGTKIVAVSICAKDGTTATASSTKRLVLKRAIHRSTDRIRGKVAVLVPSFHCDSMFSRLGAGTTLAADPNTLVYACRRLSRQAEPEFWIWTDFRPRG